MALAMEVHAVVAENLLDAVIWMLGTLMVALLIKVEKHERDNE